jgi:hypothetical protein
MISRPAGGRAGLRRALLAGASAGLAVLLLCWLAGRLPAAALHPVAP